MIICQIFRSYSYQQAPTRRLGLLEQASYTGSRMFIFHGKPLETVIRDRTRTVPGFFDYVFLNINTAFLLFKAVTPALKLAFF